MYEVYKEFTLVCRRFAEKMKPNFHTMSCSFKIEAASLCAHLQG